MDDRNGNLDPTTARSVSDRLRTSLDAARGNMQIRECLKQLVADPDRLAPIVRELGPRHALVRELLAIARHGGESGTERAAAVALTAAAYVRSEFGWDRVASKFVELVSEDRIGAPSVPGH
jgi:hypothetical protein